VFKIITHAKTKQILSHTPSNKSLAKSSSYQHLRDSSQQRQVESNQSKQMGHMDIAEIQNLAFKKMSINEIDKDIKNAQWRKFIGAPEVRVQRNSID